MTSVCGNCSHPAYLKCTGCLSINYCNAECQRKDWTRHKLECKRKKKGTEATTEAKSTEAKSPAEYEEKPSCWICLESNGELHNCCACRGSAGYIHLSCAVELNNQSTTSSSDGVCPTCKTIYTGAVHAALGKNAQESASTDARKANTLALFCCTNGDFDEALRIWKKALKQECSLELAYSINMRMAQTYAQAGKYQEAIGLCQKILAPFISAGSDNADIRKM